GGDGITFDTVKADPANFGPNDPRRFAFHYCLWTHRISRTEGISGIADIHGNDLEVGLGNRGFDGRDTDGDGLPDYKVGDVQEQATTFMHELGHNLGLNHGGAPADGVNFKPNYLSVMNYRYLDGIPPTDPDGAAGPLRARLDYSRKALA